MHKLKLVPKVGSHPKGAEDGNRHYGKICAKHPELNGLRIAAENKCVGCKKDSKKNQAASAKKQAFEYYGNSCIRCGYDDPRALTIDHVNQDGYKQRNSQGRRLSGTKLYKWLRVNNYPPGFRTLCMNCQFIVYNEHKSNE